MPRQSKQVFHARIWTKITAYDRSWHLLQPGDRILIGISGGPDSLCLAHCLYKLSKRLKMALYLLHLNHGLRGKAADLDQRFVEDFAASIGLPLKIQHIPVEAFARKNRRSLEDAGHLLRYSAFIREARRLRCNKVATAHQADDVAETFILNLMRGTKSRGLAGIPPTRPLVRQAAGYQGKRGKDLNIDVIRPILCLSRSEVLKYLRYHNLQYRLDDSNRDVKFTRNWIRLKVIPLLETRSPEIRNHIVQIASDLTTKLRA